MHNLLGCCIACTHTVECGASVDLAVCSCNFFHLGETAFCLASIQLFLRHANERGCRGICLPASAAAAGARNAVNGDDNMSKLTCRVVESREDLAVGNDTAANTRAERDHDRGLTALCRARHCLAERCSVGVVCNVHIFNCQLLFEQGEHGEIAETEVDIIDDVACVIVGYAGGCQAEREHVSFVNACFCNQLFAKRGNVMGDLLTGATCLRGCAALDDDLIFFVYDSNGDIRAAEINSNAIFHSRLSPDMVRFFDYFYYIPSLRIRQENILLDTRNQSVMPNNAAISAGVSQR